MLEAITDYLQRGESPLAYGVLALAAASEYVFPPFPGDTVSLFGAFLAATAGYSALWVHLTMTTGSVCGGMIAWAFGRAIGRHHDRWPAFMRSPRIEHAISVAIERFGRHGAVYLALNRFMPALRGFFFVAAGMHGMSPHAVAGWGAVSAAVWNALLLAAGYSVGKNWSRLRTIGEHYGWTAFGVLAFVALVLLVRSRLRR